jgi:hypothetical protein
MGQVADLQEAASCVTAMVSVPSPRKDDGQALAASGWIVAIAAWAAIIGASIRPA